MVRLKSLLTTLFGRRRDTAGRDGAARAPDSPDREGDDVDPFDPFPEPVRLEITDVFDLHTIRPREVRAVVEEYLREAHRKGFRQVRIIHGKGVGVQREAVRAVLAHTPFVEHFSDAPPEAGGWGATVARLTEVAGEDPSAGEP